MDDLVDLFSWHFELLGLYIGFDMDYWRPTRTFDTTFSIQIGRKPLPTNINFSFQIERIPGNKIHMVKEN